jgi:hypothetical protein
VAISLQPERGVMVVDDVAAPPEVRGGRGRGTPRWLL